MRHLAKTVVHVLPKLFKLFIVGYVLQLAIQHHAFAAPRHIAVGEVHLQIALYGTVFHKVVAGELYSAFRLPAIHVAELLVFQFRHSLVQYLLIRLISKVFHKSALFRSEKIAGTAYVEVLHGEVEAASQLGERLESLQTAARLLRKPCLRRREKIAESLLVAAPYPAAHLMKGGKPEAMGVVYYYGVGIAYVHTVLHNRCRNQHVVVVVYKSHYHLLKLFGLHLPVTYCHTRIGNIFVDKRCQFGKAAYAVVDEKHLSVAAHLKVYGIAYHILVKRVHLRADGIAVWRRCLYDAHVTRAHKRELQCARYRRCTHGERVHIGLHLPQLLLCRHAELLFFIYYEQSEVLELHCLAYELVGADDDVYTPRLKIGKHLPGFLRTACA